MDNIMKWDVNVEEVEIMTLDFNEVLTSSDLVKFDKNQEVIAGDKVILVYDNYEQIKLYDKSYTLSAAHEAERDRPMILDRVTDDDIPKIKTIFIDQHKYESGVSEGTDNYGFSIIITDQNYYLGSGDRTRLEQFLHLYKDDFGNNRTYKIISKGVIKRSSKGKIFQAVNENECIKLF